MHSPFIISTHRSVLCLLLIAGALSSCELPPSAQHGRPELADNTIAEPAPLSSEEAIAARDLMLKLTGGSDVWRSLKPWRAPFNSYWTMRPSGAIQIKYDSLSNRVHFKGRVSLVDSASDRHKTWRWAYEGSLSIEEFSPQDGGSYICRSPIPPVKTSGRIYNKWQNHSNSGVEIVFLVLTSDGIKLMADDKFIMWLQP